MVVRDEGAETDALLAVECRAVPLPELENPRMLRV